MFFVCTNKWICNEDCIDENASGFCLVYFEIFCELKFIYGFIVYIVGLVDLLFDWTNFRFYGF